MFLPLFLNIALKMLHGTAEAMLLHTLSPDTARCPALPSLYADRLRHLSRARAFHTILLFSFNPSPASQTTILQLVTVKDRNTALAFTFTVVPLSLS